MIKFIKKIVFLAFFMCFICATQAYAADNIFSKIIAKSTQVLVAAKNISYVIAGLGLIVFSWSAIFGKISWKHFFNIAIGLFMLSAMGAFISFFITKSGGDYTSLQYGNSLGTSFQDTNGTTGSL
ncbi:MAG: hypothetical protein R3Y43_05430 [Alphaproteobacteria bacterium]